MSTSQKHKGYSVVPWYNRSEWEDVYNVVLQISHSFDKELQMKAYNILTIWKQRMNLLASGIEGTLFLLEALNANLEVLTAQQSALIYASSIMRFLNVCVTGRAHGKNFTRTVKKTTIPDWIIGIRHDFAHSYKFPSFDTLRLAIEHCFKWIVEHYWEEEFTEIKDFIITPKSSDDIFILFGCYTQVITDLIQNQGIIQEETNEEVRRLFPDCSSEGVDLFNEMTQILKDVEFLSDDCKDEILKGVVSTEVFYFEGCSDEDISQSKVPALQRKLIENLLDVLNKQDLLVGLINVFSDILNDFEENVSHKLCIAFWLEEIFNCLALCRHTNLNISEGFQFKEGVSQKVYSELEGLFTKIFKSFDPVLLAAFKTFMLIWAGKFDDHVTEYYVTMMNIMNGQCDEQETEIEFNNICLNNLIEESTTQKTVKKRWVLEPKNIGYEYCALGVLPYG